MPEIRAFRGILYDPERVPPADVVAPPYDVISPEEQRRLYDRHPANVIRLILGREEDRYASAARHFSAWRSEGIMTEDAEPSLYILRHDLERNGREVSRCGIVAACRLEDLGTGSILPHEKTLSKPKEDRFRLFRATGAMFSQIFSLYGDPGSRIERAAARVMLAVPRIDLEADGVRNRLWSVSDRGVIETIAAVLAGTKAYVADGHHRYETALLYRDAARLEHPDAGPDAAHEFLPMFFTNMDDPGLMILPTHRMVHGLPQFDERRLLEALREYFDVAEGRLEAGSGQKFGLAVGPGPAEYTLTFKHRGSLAHLPAVLAQLDVTVLHELVMKRILGMSDEDQALKRFLDYTVDADAARRAVAGGTAQAAFFLHATPVGQLRSVAEAGMTMPQKSTYFYPKLLSGLVTYSFRGT